MKDITFAGIAVAVIAFMLTFMIVQMVFDRFGVKDAFFPLTIDALISTLVLVYYPRGD